MAMAYGIRRSFVKAKLRSQRSEVGNISKHWEHDYLKILTQRRNFIFLSQANFCRNFFTIAFNFCLKVIVFTQIKLNFVHIYIHIYRHTKKLIQLFESSSSCARRPSCLFICPRMFNCLSYCSSISYCFVICRKNVIYELAVAL